LLLVVAVITVTEVAVKAAAVILVVAMDDNYNSFKFSVRHVVVVESARLRSSAQ